MAEHTVDLGFLSQLLGADNVKKVQDALTEMIIENLEESVDAYPMEPPDEALAFIDEQYMKVVQKVLKDYKPALEKRVRAQIEQYLTIRQEKE